MRPSSENALNPDPKTEKADLFFGRLVREMFAGCARGEEQVALAIIPPPTTDDPPVAIAVAVGEPAIRKFQQWIEENRDGKNLHTGMYLCKSAEGGSDA